jgi:predicted anti-sigma-YlaC factor YlaD
MPMMRKMRRGIPSAVALTASLAAMMLVRSEWAAQAGLFVYFSVLVALTDGIDIFDRERLERFMFWRNGVSGV